MLISDIDSLNQCLIATWTGMLQQVLDETIGLWDNWLKN